MSDKHKWLRERAHLLAKAHSTLNCIPAVRKELVNGLREEIDAGTYQVPIEVLADKLIIFYIFD